MQKHRISGPVPSTRLHTHPPKRDMLLGYLGQHSRSRGHRALAPWRLTSSLDDLEAYSHWTASGWSPVNDPKQFRTRASKFCKAIPCAIRAAHRMLWVTMGQRKRHKKCVLDFRTTVLLHSSILVPNFPHHANCSQTHLPSKPLWSQAKSSSASSRLLPVIA